MTLRIEYEMKRICLYFLWFCFCFLPAAQGWAEETYWLTHVAAPFKPPAAVHPYLENPANNTGDVAAITINGGRVLFNGEWCDYRIEKIRPFKLDRLLSDLIDDMGGRKSLDAFLFRKLKTSVDDWREEISIKQSMEQVDEAPCKLLQGATIYRGKNELIFWDSTYFYRFKLGEKFKY